ncbi:uv excision repair protein [Cyclospora cayetanensis]|uniref:UV excision repair protein RAD23 n=1 Tax=Cyclospora cayetanensis TaxID=88456 RepID=A0A1D3CZU5_9EIME|nr:uv excision repair protein [Cyclospora cayetanensis]
MRPSTRAARRLAQGIPEDLLPPPTPERAPAAAPAAGSSEGGVLPSPGSPPADNPLAALRSHPVFQQVRQLTQTNPQMLPQVLQMIGASNPDLLHLITQNQDAFLELLREGAPLAGDAASRGPTPGASPLLQGGVVQLTEEEMAAVERVAEAYIACDRNEVTLDWLLRQVFGRVCAPPRFLEMAANYLFENMNDFVDDDTQEEQPPTA